MPHADDRRATLAEITPAGRDVAAAATELVHAAGFGIGALGPEELEELTSILRTLRREAGDFVEED
jgi:DNA-binding MarR family transcriptional regulator